MKASCRPERRGTPFYASVTGYMRFSNRGAARSKSNDADGPLLYAAAKRRIPRPCASL